MTLEHFYNCFNPRPPQNGNSANKPTPINSTGNYATITSPFTVDIRELCNTGDLKVKPILLTQKTSDPIRNQALQPPRHGIPKNTLKGKPIHCSNQENCNFRGCTNCLLTIGAFACDNKRLPTATYAKMTPEMLETLIKSDGCKILKKHGFFRALINCGLTKAEIWGVVNRYLPKGKRKQFFIKPKKRAKIPSVSQSALEQFTKANGYVLVKTQGVCAAAKTIGLNRSTVGRIMKEHPPKEPYIRTNWARRKTGEHSNKQRLSSSVRRETLEQFLKGNGYWIAKTQGMGAAASVCGLHINSIAKILYHFSMMLNEQPNDAPSSPCF